MAPQTWQSESDPSLAAESPLTNNSALIGLDGHEYPDTQSLSSSSNDFDISFPTSASPASSAYSDLRDEADHRKRFEVQLPEPFYPPSMAQVDKEVALKPRKLPVDLGLPAVPEEKAGSIIDIQDKATPDSWIPRDNRLVRLTGKHPFNCEAKLKDLYAEGFLTPSSLFYVRNHGAVPKIDQEMANSWVINIHGLCVNPVMFTYLIVCAGNRRKEQNVVRKSLGFSWGAGGLSTALFTGVYLCDILEYVRPTKAAKHVIFEGCDDLPNGPYGTSQRLSWARDKRKGMLLSWAMNGLALEPDHGYPLRLVVPAQIGGRSVKWLNRIELSDRESQHHLHFHDNKVLPMPLGPDQARAEKNWWYDPRYIINDLNVNSAIACPDHDEVLTISGQVLEQAYTIKGYAYAGGGRRVTRVEVSFDDGCTWSLAGISYPEDLFRAVVHSDSTYGTIDLTDSDTCFCWCFWSYEASYELLNKSAAVMVRCMDESLALQPRDMYWNATGMMNNWWFRVVIRHEVGDKLRFEHPTMAGTQPGGWMQRIKDEGGDPTKPNFSGSTSTSQSPQTIKAPPIDRPMTKPGINRKISVYELEAHSRQGDPWFVVKGEVYNGAGFLRDHPGGSHSITLVAGEDTTEEFMAIHSSDAKKQLADFHIGTLVGTPTPKKDEVDDRSGPFLSQTKWKKVQLVNIETLSKDAKIYRFALQRPDQELGLPIGQHVFVRLRRKVGCQGVDSVVEGELVQRAYTPISKQYHRGFIDLLIKIYYPNSKFPLGGRMTLGFDELMIGDSVEIKGPIGHFIWKGNGMVELHGQQRCVREIGMVCGGSGITPILQVLRGILHDSSHHDTKVWIIDVNRYFDDILCRDELHQLVKEHGQRYRLHHTLTGGSVPDDWEYSTGRLNNETLISHLPSPAEDKIVCICGPTAMEQATKGALEGIGWDLSTQIVVF